MIDQYTSRDPCDITYAHQITDIISVYLLNFCTYYISVLVLFVHLKLFVSRALDHYIHALVTIKHYWTRKHITFGTQCNKKGENQHEICMTNTKLKFSLVLIENKTAFYR